MRGAGNISGLSGWTQFSSNFISASGNNKQWIYYKVVDGTEPSSWTITPQFSASVAAAAILVCQGVDPISPIAASSQANGGAGVSTHGTAAFTAPISKAQVPHLFGFHSLVTTTPDAPTTEVYDYQNTPIPYRNDLGQLDMGRGLPRIASAPGLTGGTSRGFDCELVIVFVELHLP